MPRRSTLTAAIAAATLALAYSSTLAGPLDPPAGPVAPTHKTLTDVEPRTPIGPDTTPGNPATIYQITQPGSYYLTGDVAGIVNRHGIYVSAPDVTIDLNGFTLRGVVGAAHGIYMSSDARNLVVRDGHLTGWDDAIAGLSGSGSRYERLTIDGGRGQGIVTGNSCVVSDCTVRFCADTGINAGFYSTVTDCSVSGNGSGIILLSNGTATDCFVHNNEIYGISAGSRSLIRGNHCVLNGLDNTSGAGIHTAGQLTRIEGNSLVQNERGIHVTGTRNVIVSNSASLNGTNYSIGGTNTAGPVTSDLATASAWANIAH